MRASSYDRSGGNRDWVNIPPQQSKEITLKGCGIIKHIWTTFLHQTSGGYDTLQIQFEFDGIATVDMPLCDFFALPTGGVHNINSLPIQVSRTTNHPNKDNFESFPYRGGLNCYWEMPFLQECKITLVNNATVAYNWYYHIDWEQHATLPANILYFYATKNSQTTTVQGKYMGHGKIDFDEIHDQDTNNYVFCDINGYRGHYMGISLMVEATSDCNTSWWEGDEMFIIDGEQWPPRIHGTGLEDYFGLAYGFRVVDCRPQYGISYITKNTDDERQIGGTCCMYRFHFDSPIVFTSSFKASVEHGHANGTDAFYSSVVYWYGRKK